MRIFTEQKKSTYYMEMQVMFMGDLGSFESTELKKQAHQSMYL